MYRKYRPKEIPELILLTPEVTEKELREKPETLRLNCLFYVPGEPEIEGDIGRHLKDKKDFVKKVSWEPDDIYQLPHPEYKAHMMKVTCTGYIIIDEASAQMVYTLKQPLAVRMNSYIGVLTQGIPGGITQCHLDEEGQVCYDPHRGSVFSFEGSFYQFNKKNFRIKGKE